MRFNKPFTKQPALPASSLTAGNRVLSSADLHRYQVPEEGHGEVSELEAEFAAWQGAKYCLAITSGGQALQLAMRAAGVKTGDPVLTNAFTLAPVPGAIRAVGGKPVLVEVNEDLVIDLLDLEAKSIVSGAKVLLLSHMRGHLVDMDALCNLAEKLSLTIIEDCAHTMGATWDGEKSGNFGVAGCFSTQSYKHLNSGEGGFLTTDDPDLMAQAIILSGSYVNFDRHGAAPDASYFESAKYDCPNMSARMDALRAAVLRPQLAELDANIERWIQLCKTVEQGLSASNYIQLPKAPIAAQRVGSSIQFRIPDFSDADCLEFLDVTKNRGVELKWFGRDEPAGFTSLHKHWRYMSAQDLPQTDHLLSTLFDMRLPLTFDEDDCILISEIIVDVAANTRSDRH
jgi:dTDP-4-amino-4,6-dideoxygalactose transaminase